MPILKNLNALVNFFDFCITSQLGYKYDRWHIYKSIEDTITHNIISRHLDKSGCCYCSCYCCCCFYYYYYYYFTFISFTNRWLAIIIFFFSYFVQSMICTTFESSVKAKIRKFLLQNSISWFEFLCYIIVQYSLIQLLHIKLLL